LNFTGLHEPLVIEKLNCDQANYQCNVAKERKRYVCMTSSKGEEKNSRKF